MDTYSDQGDQVSKPETPCLPECRYSEGLDGVIKTCAPGCPNAPKAEAPPAPVSEPPIDPRSREAADALIAKLKAENDALKAQNATLTAEVERLNIAMANVSNTADAELATARAEVERLRDLIDDIAKIADFQIPPYAYGDNVAACDMAHRLDQILRAAREAGKA